MASKSLESGLFAVLRWALKFRQVPTFDSYNLPSATSTIPLLPSSSLDRSEGTDRFFREIKKSSAGFEYLNWPNAAPGNVIDDCWHPIVGLEGKKFCSQGRW
jgi:hypothetical protein